VLPSGCWNAWLLFAATGVLLGLACLNAAGLFLARGSARGREIGTRLALGASRGGIGRQLLVNDPRCLFLAKWNAAKRFYFQHATPTDGEKADLQLGRNGLFQSLFERKM
jgi:hypothetical protein